MSDYIDTVLRERSREVGPTRIEVHARMLHDFQTVAFVRWPDDDCDMRTFYTEGNAGPWGPLAETPSMPDEGCWVFVGTVTHTETTGGPYPGADHIRFAGAWRAANWDERDAIDNEIENA